MPPGWPAMSTRRCVASSPSRAVAALTARLLTYTRCLRSGAMYGMSTEHCRSRPLHAIILAGGASTRLGVDKPEQLVGGRRLLDIALAAVADADAVVVVGPPREVPTGVTVVREDPPQRGPAAALAAGFAALPDGPADIAVLAADLPRITAEAVKALAAARSDAPVALAVDDD